MVSPKSRSISLKKILVPVDGSEISLKAVNYAVHFAKLASAQLIPIYIIEDIKQGGALGLQERYGNISIVKAFKNSRKQSAEVLLKKIENSAKKSRVKVKNVILDSAGKNEKKMVTEYAVKNKVDLIIIGSKSQSRFRGLWIGGFTNSVLHHSTVPVLVVP